MDASKLGQRHGLSELDIHRVRRAYKCEKSDTVPLFSPVLSESPINLDFTTVTPTPNVASLKIATPASNTTTIQPISSSNLCMHNCDFTQHVILMISESRMYV